MARLLFVLLLAWGGAGSAVAANLPPHWQLGYPDLDGQTRTLSQWQGRIVAVNFWATWCPPCLREIPEFVEFQAAHEGELQIVGIGMDDADKLANVARTLNINYPILVSDPRQNLGLLSEWGNNRGVVPYTVFFDADGEMRIKHRGPLDRETLESYFAELQLPRKR